MENARIKKEMLDLFRSLRNELAEVLANLNEPQKQECGSLQRWGVKDMLTHLAFWGDHFNRQVEAARAGSPVPDAGDYYEIINDGVLLRNKGKTFEEARQEEEDSIRQDLSHYWKAKTRRSGGSSKICPYERALLAGPRPGNRMLPCGCAYL